MMTHDEILAAAKALGNDAIVLDFGKRISVDFNDFEDFDEDYAEIYRDYDNVAAVDAFEAMIQNEAKEMRDGGLYRHYYFDGFEVVIGYTSYDI